MVYIQAARKAYQERKIDNVWWLKSNSNLADGLTKLKIVELLKEAMRTGKFQVVADQWIIRPPLTNKNTDTFGIISADKSEAGEKTNSATVA